MTSATVKAIARKYSAFRLCLDSLAEIIGAQIMYTDGDCFSGFLVFEPAGKYQYLIVINGAESEQRQRYTIAHELGHIILKHKRKKARFFQKNCFDLTLQEKYANIFASELLMPTCEVYSCVREGLTFEEMCDYFFVSKQAMAVKLKELNLQGLIP